MAKGQGWTLGELAEMLGGEAHGDLGQRFLRPVPSDSDDPEGISFAESEEYLRAASASKAGCVIVPRGTFLDRTHLQVDHPRQAFRELLFRSSALPALNEGVHQTAVLHPDAEVDPTASIGPYAVVEAGARVGPAARIYPFAYVGEGCSVGEGTILYPHAVLLQDVEVGRFCILHSGAVLGADGFGFGWDGSRRVKIPQVGGVRLGDEVEVGANTAIDRATMGETVVGTGTKLDNLIQVGHNVRIGDHSVIAGHTAFGGSSSLGSRSMVGGHVAITDHAAIGDDVMIAGRSGVTNDVKEPGQYFGLPLQPHREGLRALVLSAKLPELFSRIRALERRLQEMEGE